MDTPASRLTALVDLVPDLTLRELDRLAGPTDSDKARSHAQKIVERAGGMSPETAKAYAPVLGTTDAWLLLGFGRPPGERAVRRAVAAARERLRDPSRHEPRMRARGGSVEGQRLRRGSRMDRCKRPGGRPG